MNEKTSLWSKFKNKILEQNKNKKDLKFDQKLRTVRLGVEKHGSYKKKSVLYIQQVCQLVFEFVNGIKIAFVFSDTHDRYLLTETQITVFIFWFIRGTLL